MSGKGILFCGFDEGVYGRKYSEKTLKSMTKSELIELLRISQKNYDTMMEFYKNAVKANIKQHEKIKMAVEQLSKISDGFEKEIKFHSALDDYGKTANSIEKKRINDNAIIIIKGAIL